MCINCYQDHGSPRARHAQTERLVELLSVADNYGALHIVVEDWNLESNHIKWCIEENRVVEPTDNDKEIAQVMLSMDLEERATAMGIAEGFLTLDQTIQPSTEDK